MSDVAEEFAMSKFADSAHRNEAMIREIERLRKALVRAHNTHPDPKIRILISKALSEKDETT